MIGLASYTAFRDDIRAHGLEYAAQQGFDSVEFLEVLGSDRPIRPLLGTPEEIRRILGDHHLSVACFSVAADLLNGDTETVERQLREQIDLAAAIGSPFVHHTLVPALERGEDAPSYDEVSERIFPAAERIAAYCNARGMTCLYEPQGMYFNGIDGLRPLLTRMKERGHRVGICGDLGNSLFVDCPPEAILAQFAKDVKHVHVKDLSVSDTKPAGGAVFRTRSGKWLRETLPGHGSVDLAQCFSLLKRMHYEGKIGFEFTADDETTTATLQSIAASVAFSDI